MTAKMERIDPSKAEWLCRNHLQRCVLYMHSNRYHVMVHYSFQGLSWHCKYFIAMHVENWKTLVSIALVLKIPMELFDVTQSYIENTPVHVRAGIAKREVDVCYHPHQIDFPHQNMELGCSFTARMHVRLFTEFFKFLSFHTLSPPTQNAELRLLCLSLSVSPSVSCRM